MAGGSGAPLAARSRLPPSRGTTSSGWLLLSQSPRAWARMRTAQDSGTHPPATGVCPDSRRVTARRNLKTS